MTLRLDGPFWGVVIAFALAGACVALFGVAARAAGIIG